MSTARFQVRIWSADNSSWRSLPLKFVLSANWRLMREGGYGDATLRLRGLLSDPALSDIKGERRIEFYGRNPLPSGGLSSWVRLYRGLVKQPDESAGQPRITTVTLYGLYQQVSSYPCFQRYAFPGEIDIAAAFSRVANKWIKPKVPGLVVRGDATGVMVESLDAYRRTLSDVAQELMGYTGGLVAVGADADEGGNDRLFLRPFGEAATPTHVWPIPAPPQSYWKIGARERRVDYRSIANVLHLAGGSPKHPNLAPRGAGFEYPTLGGADTGNLLDNGGFESNAANWTLSGGASTKSGNGAEGTTDGGDTMLELDAALEKALQNQYPPPVAIIVGDNYTHQVRARRESGTASSTVEMRLIWRTSANAIISTEIRTISPDSVTWETFSLTTKAPPLAARFTLEFEMTVDGGDGIMLDNASVFNASRVYAEGLEVYPTGTASVDAINWAFEDDACHGAYCLYFKVTSSDVDNNDVAIRRAGNEMTPVQPRQSIRLSCWVKNAPGASSVPKLQLQIFHFKGEEFLNATIVNVASASYADWTLLTVSVTVGADCTAVQWDVVPRGSGEGLLDSVSLRDDSTDPDEYIEGVYEAILRADVLGAGDVADSITDYGERPALVDMESINNKADADRYGEAALTTRALPLQSPLIELIGRAVELWPGEFVRAVGKEAEIILPESLPIVEVEGKWSGVLSLTAYLDTERPNETRTARQIAKDAARRSAGNSQVSFGGRVTSTQSGGGAGSAGILPVEAGGTGADNASDALTNLGIGSGVSGTITLIGPTTNGSITVLNGIITAFTDPT